MDDSIAPVGDGSGEDPIAAYRRYLEAKTGDRAMGVGPQLTDSIDQNPPQGAGPSIAPAAPPDAAPDAGGIAPAPQAAAGAPQAAPQPSATIAPVAAQAPQAPQAAQAAQAPKARKAAMEKGAKNAPQAPMIAPVQGQGPQAPDDPTAQPAFGPNAAPISLPNSPTAPDLGDPAQYQPAAAHVVKGAKTADGKPQINVKPPDIDDSDFGKGKVALKDVHTAHDLVDSLPPAKQTAYMDWWEKQHGDIDQRYDAMLQDLGQRPDPNRDMTRQEKFKALMNFGLTLMANARRGTDQGAAIGNAAKTAMDMQQEKQQGQTASYDQRAALIQKQRNDAQKDIGNYGNAVREEALIQDANVRTANALKPPRPQPVRPAERTFDAKGNMRVRNDDPTSPNFGKWEMALDEKGNPLPPQQVTGPKGGAGKTPARQAELDDLIHNKGMDPNAAIDKVYGSGTHQADPTKTWTSVYNRARGLGETPSDSATEANTATTMAHGPGALAQTQAARNRTNVPTTMPPPSAVPPGKRVTFKNGRTFENNGGTITEIK